MHAVILAAGVGSRLTPLTDDKPKTLVEVNGKPMLGYILDALAPHDLKGISICLGYKQDAIIEYCQTHYPHLPLNFVENPDYATTNNMYSLYCSRDAWGDDDLLIMNADLVFDPQVIPGLIKAEGSAVAVEEGAHNDESMKIVVKDDFITSISKQITPEEGYGCSIDVYKIAKADVPTLLESLLKIIEEDKDLNQWTELLLDRMFQSGDLKAKPHNIDGLPWYEIDNFEDLAKAEILFNPLLAELKEKKVFFLDRDGTLTLGKSLIDGANDFLQYLNVNDRKFFVLTNNSSKSPKQHFEAFRNVGLEVSEENVLVSIMPALDFLKEQNIHRLHVLATPSVLEYIQEMGFSLDTENPEALLLTYDTTLDYDKLTAFVHHVHAGIPYYATHIDVVCPTENGYIPDIGTFIQSIQAATERMPDKTFGKPDMNFIQATLDHLGLREQDAVIVGDRLYTDIQMAEDRDLLSVLVLSGETSRVDYELSPICADIVVPQLTDLIPYI
jgi:HAD superfamily hydrolase (TIGR01450 family)